MGTDPKLDIWGNSSEGQRDCFYCGNIYIQAKSTASIDYIGTYCSWECQNKDTEQMKLAAEAEARFTNHEGEPKPPATTIAEVGPFKLKVRKDT